MKYLKIIVIVCALLMAGAALAEENSSATANPSSAAINPPAVVAPGVVREDASARELNRLNRVDKLKARAAKLIDERLRALAKLKTRVSSKEKLTEAQKTELIPLIDEQTTKLTAFGATIKNSSTTDVNVLRDEVKKIYSDYRIFAVFIPKVQALIALDQQTNHIVRVNERLVKVQAKIDEAKAKGKDMTAWQKALDAAKATLAGVPAKIQTLKDKALTLKPADYPTTSKAVIGEIRTGLREIHKTFSTINAGLRRPGKGK